MAKNVRNDMITGAAKLLSERGLEATSFSEVLGETGAPRGSVYHHFPGGKTELVIAAVDAVSERFLSAVPFLDGCSIVEAVDLVATVWRSVLADSDCQAGCAIAAVAVGAAADRVLADRTGEVFAGWTSALARTLRQAGLARSSAQALATTTLAAIEGALIMSRAQHSLAPFDLVARQLHLLAEANVPKRRP
jgi:TetR/AcrR family transcriptional regulator, lmrAB and yxaGH operons repressor